MELWKTKCWLCLLLNAAQNPTPSCKYCSLFLLDAPCNLYSVLFTSWQALVPMCMVHSSTLCRKCLLETGTYVSCLMKCQSERISVSIRRLTVLRVLRTVEQRGLTILQIMLEFFMVHSLNWKWKLPVAYYFSCGSCKANLLVMFLAHARMLDCKLLPLSVTWVPTVSRPWNCWVLPDGSHSSTFRIKILWQCMFLHTSWSVP